LTISLRDYQQEAVDAVMDQFQTVQSTLVTLPTGCGKTVTAAEIIRRHLDANPRKRVMCIAHREELIFQGAKAIEKITGEHVAIEMADQWSDETPGMFGADPARVVFATVQTLSMSRGGRMDRFRPSDFCLFWTDEAHHSTAETYRKVTDYFCASNPQCKHLGVTATPDRGDEEALGQIYQSVAYEYGILDAIHGGYLVPVKSRQVFVDGLDFSNVRTTAGDLNGADLAELLEEESNLHGVVNPTIEIAGNRRTLVFAGTVKQAERISEIFNRHNPQSARIVHGGTPKDERRQMLADYAAGRFQTLCNVGVATEGFDSPGIEVVVMARPTKSRALYAQMAGRGMRILPGVIDHVADPAQRKNRIAGSAKPSCLILDFVGNSGRHKLIAPEDILGGKLSDEVVAKARDIAKKKGNEEVDMAAALEQAERDISEAKRRAIKAKAKFRVQDMNPFDVLDITPGREAAWHKGRKPTDRQIEVLTNAGVPNPANLTFSEASKLIDGFKERRANGLCTFKQARFLVNKGYEDAASWSFQKAGAYMNALSKNGWKKLSPEQEPVGV